MTPHGDVFRMDEVGGGGGARRSTRPCRLLWVASDCCAYTPDAQASRPAPCELEESPLSATPQRVRERRTHVLAVRQQDAVQHPGGLNLQLSQLVGAATQRLAVLSADAAVAVILAMGPVALLTRRRGVRGRDL